MKGYVYAFTRERERERELSRGRRRGSVGTTAVTERISTFVLVGET